MNRGRRQPSVSMVVSNRYDPDPRVHKEALSLAEAGWRVTIYAFDRMHERREEETLEHGVLLKRIRVGKSPVGSLLATGLGLRAFKAEVRRQLLESPTDVVHCHDQDTCSVGLWWKFVGSSRSRKGRRGVFVFDSHDLYWTWLRIPDPGSKWRKIGAGALRAQARFFARMADMVITVTEGENVRPGVAEIFRDWGVKTEVVWNAPYKPETVPPMPKRFTLGWVGTIREKKAFEWLVDGLEQMDSDHRPVVLLAGGGVAQNEVVEYLGNASTSLGFDLVRIGVFSIDELPSIVARTSAQYCMYPEARGQVSRGIPTKMLDSVAYGRPVIGNEGVMFGDMIEKHGWGVTAREGDARAIAHGIERLRRMASGSHAVAFSSKARLWEQEGKKLVSLYEKLRNVARN